MYLPDCPIKTPGADCRLLPGGRERTASAADYPCVVGADYYRDSSCSLHWHEEFELILVHSGTLLAAVNGRTHALSAGEGIFVNSGVLHSYAEADGSGACLTYILFLPGLVGGQSGSVFWTKYLDPLVSSLLFSGVTLRAADWHRQILAQAQAVANLHREEPAGFEIEVRTLLSRIIRSLCENTLPAGSDGDRSSDAVQSMRRMLSYIEVNFCRDVRVEEIAASAHISTRSCQRLFQRFTASSPKQFLISLRLERAQRLLEATDHTIPEICAECGFSDQSYFTKLFRLHVGCPPALYRRQCAAGRHPAAATV